MWMSFAIFPRARPAQGREWYGTVFSAGARQAAPREMIRAIAIAPCCGRAGSRFADCGDDNDSGTLHAGAELFGLRLGQARPLAMSGGMAMNVTRQLAVLCAGCLVASTWGCAALTNSTSTAATAPQARASVAVMYRVEQVQPVAAGGVVQASATQATVSDEAATRTTLAVLYPHPQGRAGKARVFLIVEGGEGGGSGLTGLVERARHIAGDGGSSGEQSASSVRSLALDVPYFEIDRLMDRLEQRAARAENARGVSLFVRVNGTALPVRNTRVEELDRLIARVEREGNPVALKWPVNTPRDCPQESAPPVVPAVYAAPAIERLPPVGLQTARR